MVIFEPQKTESPIYVTLKKMIHELSYSKSHVNSSVW